MPAAVVCKSAFVPFVFLSATAEKSIIYTIELLDHRVLTGWRFRKFSVKQSRSFQDIWLYHNIPIGARLYVCGKAAQPTFR